MFFNDTATTEIYTLSLHDALPIYERGGLLISVEDTGIGIEPEDLRRILLPFEQVEGHMERSTKGTGLGLALSKSLTELHGGELSLESKPGAGTTVTLRFPPERALITEPELPLLHQ